MQSPCASAPILFADVDETLIRGKSLFEFATQLGRVLPEEDAAQLRNTVETLATGMKAGVPRSELNRRYYAAVLGGREVEFIAAIAAHWYRSALEKQGGLFKAGVVRFIGEARMAGARLVLLSGSFPALLEPIAAHFGAVEILSTRLTVEGGCYTGDMLGPPVIGEGKASALRAYARDQNVCLTSCFGIGDDSTDIPFLSCVGRAFVPADAQPDMLRHADSAGWGVLSP